MQDEDEPVAYEVEIRVEGVIKVMVTASTRADAEAKAQTAVRDYARIERPKAIGATAKESRPRYTGGDPKIGVHVGHCCLLHGCKYGDEDCPVTSGQFAQSYPCESCSLDEGY